jgi:hypothetical protein
MDELIEAMARAMAFVFCDSGFFNKNDPEQLALLQSRANDKAKMFTAHARAALTALQSKGWVVVPVEPTEEQLNAARDWSVAKYGQGVGNDGAKGCYAAMLSASPMNDLLRAQTRSTEADRSAG